MVFGHQCTICKFPSVPFLNCGYVCLLEAKGTVSPLSWVAFGSALETERIQKIHLINNEKNFLINENIYV